MTTVCFTENYLHEIPTEIQFQIMKTVEDSIKQEKIDDLKKRLEKYTEGPTEDDDELFEATVGEDIIYMLRCIHQDEIEFTDEDEYSDWIFKIIDEICQDDFTEDNLDRMTKLVNHYGVIKALKIETEYFGTTADLDEEEHKIYRRCYFMIVYDTYNNISYEDILLMKELKICP